MGKGDEFPIFKNALGVYNDTVLRVSEDVTPGVNSSTSASISTVRRAVFMGAQAASIGYGSNFNEGAGAYKWVNVFGPVVAKAANDNHVNSWDTLAA